MSLATLTSENSNLKSEIPASSSNPQSEIRNPQCLLPPTKLAEIQDLLYDRVKQILAVPAEDLDEKKLAVLARTHALFFGTPKPDAKPQLPEGTPAQILDVCRDLYNTDFPENYGHEREPANRLKREQRRKEREENARAESAPSNSPSHLEAELQSGDFSFQSRDCHDAGTVPADSRANQKSSSSKEFQGHNHGNPSPEFREPNYELQNSLISNPQSEIRNRLFLLTPPHSRPCIAFNSIPPPL